jgi:hypothetical protein
VKLPWPPDLLRPSGWLNGRRRRIVVVGVEPKMKLLQAIESEYAVVRALNSFEGEIAARIYATFLVAGQISPILYAFMRPQVAGLGKALQVSFGLAIALAIMVILIDARRGDYPQSLIKRSDKKTKLIWFVVVTATTIAFALLGRASPWYALFAYCLFAPLPLRNFIK